MNYRFMRTLLFFDLPSVSKSEQREYRKFVKFIKQKGFVMMQESVYTKLSLNETVVESTRKEIKAHLPKDGIVSLLTVTEKQFASIEQLVGDLNTDVVMSDAKIIKL